MKRPKKLPRGIFIRDDWYWVRYADQHGKIHREKASPMLEGAKAALEKRRTQVRELKFFPEKVKQRPVLFGEIAKSYLKIAQARKRTWREDEDHIETLAPILKDVPAFDITPAQLEEVLAELQSEREWSSATFNRYRSTLSSIFQHAMASGKVQSNPARLTRHRKESERVRYLTPDEQTKLMDAVRASDQPGREAEILVALHSGMRRSEQYRTAQVPDGGLMWKYINFRAKVIRLPRSKGNKAREIPMNSVLIETLHSIPQQIDLPYVFGGTDPEKWFVKLVSAADIEDFRWHDLRHTFGSRLAMASVPIRNIAELMGHSQIQTTMRYAHLAPGHLADAVQKLTASPAETDTSTDTRVSDVSVKVG